MASQSKAAGKRSAAAAPKFDFKKLKRDTGSGASSSSSSGGGGYSGEARPTTTRVHECELQSGEREGEKSGNRVFVFNPRFGFNDQTKAEVMKHTYGKDQVSSFNKELDGFHIRAHAPKQAQKMHAALRGLDPELLAELDLGGWTEGPEVEMVTFTNLDLPATKAAAAQEGVTALMLVGYTYPLYRGLRKLKYDFVRGVHGKIGVNHWVRVVGAKEKAAQLENEVTAFLLEEGWQVTTAAADAADWDDMPPPWV